MNRIYFANKEHTRKHGCPNLWPVAGKLFHRTPRDIFSEPGLVAYVDPKLCNHSFFEAHIAIYHTAEVVYRPNWNNDGEHMAGGCIMNAVVGRGGHVSIHSHLKARDNNIFDDSEMIWGSRQAAIVLLKEAALQFIQYFPQPGEPV
jgi:hypothetical protein